MATLTLFEKLDQIEARYEEPTGQLSSPEVHADSARFPKPARAHAELSEMVAKYREWKEIERHLRVKTPKRINVLTPSMAATTMSIALMEIARMTPTKTTRMMMDWSSNVMVPCSGFKY